MWLTTGILWRFILPLGTAIIWYFYGNQKKATKIHVDGYVDDRFQHVYDVFRQNFADGWERQGAAFAVYYKGEKVVDIWGGYMEKEASRLWKRDTLAIAFSSTKECPKSAKIDPDNGTWPNCLPENNSAMGALSIAKLVEEGRINYEDLVTKHWPEFGKNGKENVTVHMIMAHTCGLAWTDVQIEAEAAMDHEKVAKVFENQKPQWAPGTATGYHAATYGWLVDQIVRRADKEHRGIAKYFKQEIADKLGADFRIGLPIEETHRVARVQKPSLWNTIDEFLTKPSNFKIEKILKQWWTKGPLIKVARNVPWLDLVNMPINNPELYKIEQCGALGFGNARSMAEIFEALRQGKILNATTFETLITPRVESEDIVTGATVPRGQGLIMSKFQREQNKGTVTLVGHAGLGGQNVRMDIENQITLAYVSNGLKVGLGDTARTYIRLINALYDDLDKL